MEKGPPPSDPTLQHPYCVYQILRRHYAAYTPEMVERTTGCPREIFVQGCRGAGAQFGPRTHRRDLLCGRLDASHDRRPDDPRRRDDPGLLGNVGRPGGGILALRGHASIQGSTDIPTLYNMLPTYLPQPHAFKPHKTLKDYLEHRAHADRLVAQFPEIRGQPVEGVVRR